MKTPINTLLAVGEIGGKLGVTGDKLRVLLPPDCPLELKAAIRQHKPALLELLRLDFWIVRSDALNAILFWTPDESTKQSLAAAGADLGSIYTVAELQRLLDDGATSEDLPLIHRAKQRFQGKIVG